jgi:hypothetical protein
MSINDTLADLRHLADHAAADAQAGHRSVLASGWDVVRNPCGSPFWRLSTSRGAAWVCRQDADWRLVASNRISSNPSYDSRGDAMAVAEDLMAARRPTAAS